MKHIDIPIIPLSDVRDALMNELRRSGEEYKLIQSAVEANDTVNRTVSILFKQIGDYNEAINAVYNHQAKHGITRNTEQPTAAGIDYRVGGIREINSPVQFEPTVKPRKYVPIGPISRRTSEPFGSDQASADRPLQGEEAGQQDNPSGEETSRNPREEGQHPHQVSDNLGDPRQENKVKADDALPDSTGGAVASSLVVHEQETRGDNSGRVGGNSGAAGGSDQAVQLRGVEREGSATDGTGEDAELKEEEPADVLYNGRLFSLTKTRVPYGQLLHTQRLWHSECLKTGHSALCKDHCAKCGVSFDNDLGYSVFYEYERTLLETES